MNAENRALNCNVDRLLKGNRELRERQKKYEKPPKGSGKSSTHPSKEPIKLEVERLAKPLSEKTDKKIGGQPSRRRNDTHKGGIAR